MEYLVASIKGKQYILELDQQIRIDRVKDEEGQKIKFDQVLLSVNDQKVKLGLPLIEAEAEGKIIAHVQGPKKQGVKYQPKGHRKKFGQREKKTLVQITKLNHGA